jgi:tetratricopeptide (TPR) repeat protein/predicted Ser/Thr protein kinase
MPSPPEQVGPYRILEPLGAGGMGEVFLAYDQRLDRKVAIKRIRPEGDVPEERRERFRREARIAARLSHPSIVHVYDVIAEGDTDFIVMEYVEGDNLRRLVRDGPLEVDRAVSIGLDVARGLAEAHRQGIVHRDLKTENILVTPSGHAKITDFGIAKRMLRDGTEESLTRGGFVVGTYRAMSPEQARGEEVDHRSDLFSLGVLLYEMLTGSSPFEADNELAILNRIVQHRQRPAREVNPVVPEELSRLVDHLLEKDPLLRPRNAGEVARALGVLAAETLTDETRLGTLTELPPRPHSLSSPLRGTGGAATAGRMAESALTGRHLGLRTAGWVALAAVLALGSALAWRALRTPAEPLYVAVLQPEIGAEGGGIEASLLTSGVRVALVRGLVALEGISPKAFEEVDAVSGSVREVAKAVSADEVIGSQLDCNPEACRVSLSRFLGRDGSVLWADSFEVPTDNFYLIAGAVENQIQRGYGGREPREGTAELAASSQDLRRFLELRRRFDSRRAADLSSILAELAALRGRSPRFLEVYLLEAEVARYKFHFSRDPRDLARAFDLVRQARSLAPGDPQPLLLLIDVALAGGRLDDAGEALQQLGRMVPGDVRVLERQADLLNAQGKPEEALELLETATRRHPSWKRLARLARLEKQTGRIAEARGHLQQLLRNSPGNVEGLSLLAQIELSSGDPRRAAELYGELVRRSPSLSALSNLGLAQFLLGEYGKAAETFGRAVDQEPRNPLNLLNLADAYFLLGRRSDAERLYRRVVELIEGDPAASGAQFFSVKAQALAHLGEGPRAVEAIQEALRLAPDSGSTAYEASLVYALLGEDDSALVYAERALQRGYEPRWFSFPWFGDLESRPDFRSLLAAAAKPEPPSSP